MGFAVVQKSEARRFGGRIRVFLEGLAETGLMTPPGVFAKSAEVVEKGKGCFSISWSNDKSEELEMSRGEVRRAAGGEA